MQVDYSKVEYSFGGDIEDFIYEGELYTRCLTYAAMKQWCEHEGWASVEEFEEQTHVSHETVLGKWFTVIHNRVFVGTEDTLPTGHLH